MASIPFATLFPEQDATENIIKDYLDHPAGEFVKEVTMNTIMKRSYNIVTHQVEIDASNQTLAIDVIYAITVWHVFGAYMNSMPDNLQDNNKFDFAVKLKHYKGIAMSVGNMLGIDVTGESIVGADDTPVVIGGVGMSVYKDADYFDEAAGNKETTL